MLEIGKKLQEERIKQGLSLEDMSRKTRFSTMQLEALENGDLDFFKDDISYVKFFIQYYCKALNLNYDDFRDDMDQSMITYTNMLSAKEVEQLRNANEKLQQKIKQNGPTKKKQKMDFSLVSLLVIAALMLLALSFVMGKYIFPNLMDQQGDQDQVINTDLPNISTTPKDEVPVDTACDVLFNMVNMHTYEIRNVNDCESIDIRIEFTERETWIQSTVNGVEDPNIKSKVYKIGESVETVLSNENDQLKLHLGYYSGNKFYINDTEVNLDPSIANMRSGDVVYFTVKGE
ncbi:MAG: hypothetical protein E7191_05150 [Erysipelotrichaceae bacterium]|nr:hypothetical protein [Erysipelotrichaceae bacterium]